MLNEKQLLDRLLSSETHWVERKQAFRTDAKKTIVAFANSVPENEHAVLFIGVTPGGKSLSIENADKQQRDIRQ